MRYGKIISLIGLLGLMILSVLAGCHSGGDGDGIASSATTTITFIHYNDLHAHLTTHADVVPDAPVGQTSTNTKVVQRGGLARIATLIKQIRAQNPNNILMNVGDTFHGGAEALFTNGNAIAAPVNVLGIDVGVPGNWDFAYGPMVTRRRYTDMSAADLTLFEKFLQKVYPGYPVPAEVLGPNYPNLAANVTYTEPPTKAGQTMLPPTMTKVIDGVTVGFIGITSDIVPYMHPILAVGLSFVEGETNYQNLINTYAKSLRSQGAQIVVVMSELGIQKDYRLAQIVDPGVDVFFSAHTHEATFTPLTSTSGALVVEAGNDGFVGRMDIAVQSGVVVSRTWQLLPVGSDVAEDPDMKALVDQARAPFLATNPSLSLPAVMGGQTLTQPITTVVGMTAGALDRRRALESNFNNAFADVIRRKSGTQLAMSPGFRFDAVIAEPGATLEDNTVADGKITLEDVYRFFPVPFTISTAEITGNDLRQAVLEPLLSSVFSSNVFYQRGGWVAGFSGMKVTLNLANPDGSPISSMALLDGTPITSSTNTLSITGCARPLDKAGSFCGYDGFSNLAPVINPATSTAWTPVDIFVDSMATGTILTSGARRDLTDTNNTAVWPETPYVQPLIGVGP